MAWGAEKLAVFADLAAPARRKDAARALATALGAEDLIIFATDPELGILLPAPGFPQTLPGGAAWQALLRSAVAAGRAFGPVTPPGGESAKESLAVAGRDGSAVVLIGCTEEDGEVAWFQALLPLLAGTFRGERMALTAEGNAAVARAAATQAEALAVSLDRVRRELGEALARAKATADENARLYAEVQDADRRKDEFLATLAHELRNPLAPVRNGLQVLKLAPPGPAAAKTRDMMERQLTHMVRLIDDLLDVSRISRGKVELKRERVRVQSLVDAAVEASRPAIDAGRHVFTMTLRDEPLWLDADPTRMAQVISNLLTNAAKYTPEGGRIDLTARREGGQVVIEVRDTGVGIPADMLPKVFEMFTQVGRNLDRAQGGLGIGLSLVRRLAEMHGGTAEAKSEGQDQGSTFTVRLPLAAGGGLGDYTPGAEAAAKAQKRKRILVVDDNVDGAESLSMLLQLSGHDTRTAYSGPEALAAADEYRPDVVFLDIGLPGMNGYEVARLLRQEASLSRPVLVALTGWGTESDKRQAMDAGFDYHLTKPVESKAVDAVLIESCGLG
jgi:signal transduction histidine kinase/ActR/RegA family two-component response regulator